MNLILNASDIWTLDSKWVTAARFDKGDWATVRTDINPQAMSFWHKRFITDQTSYRVVAASADDQRWYFAFEPGYSRAVIRSGTNYYTFANAGNYFLEPEDDLWHWYYIEFYSGSNAQLYVDNVYRGQVTTFFNTNTYKLHTIGNGGDDVTNGVYGFGLLDDLRIYTTYRLTAAQKTAVFTLSPEPGSLYLSGSAVIQPIIVAGHFYAYIGKGGITLRGSRYTYVVKSTIIITSGSGTASHTIEYSYTGSGTASAEGASAFHDFGLGYIYDIVTGGIELSSQALHAIIIEDSYIIIIFQTVGKVTLSGSAITGFTQTFIYSASGNAVLSGTALYTHSVEYNFAGSGGITVSGYIIVSKLIVGGGDGRLGSWDGANWKNYDGSGTGTGPYSSTVVGTGIIWPSTVYSSYLVAAGGRRLGSFDGTNWKNYDGTGTGTGPYNNLTVIGTGYIWALTAYGSYLIVAGDYGRLGSWDGTNWKNYDGTGTGTGPYDNGTVIGTNTIQTLTVFGSYLIVGGGDRLGSWDGANWKNYDGSGAGTGPYSNGVVLGTSYIYTLTVYGSYLIVAGDNCRLGSFDGTNWKNYDGTGTGTGPYNNNTVLGSAVGIHTLTVYGNYLIVSGSYGRLGSWDGTNWKNYNGTGTGTGPYNTSTVLGVKDIFTSTRIS